MKASNETFPSGEVQYRCFGCGKIYRSRDCAEACCTVQLGSCAGGFHSKEHQRAVLQDRQKWAKIKGEEHAI